VGPTFWGKRRSQESSIVPFERAMVVFLSLVHIGDKIDFDFVDRAVDRVDCAATARSIQSTARSTASRLQVDRIGVTVVT